jgi:hypothetical protein
MKKYTITMFFIFKMVNVECIKLLDKLGFQF